MAEGIAPDGTWPPTHPTQYGYGVNVPTPKAGTSATYTFGFQAPAALTPGILDVTVAGMTKANVRLSESSAYNGPATDKYRVVN